jgi:hypothetical protein
MITSCSRRNHGRPLPIEPSRYPIYPRGALSPEGAQESG